MAERRIPLKPPQDPNPPRPAKVETGDLNPAPSSRVLQGSTPWQVDGSTVVTESTLPAGAASESTLEQVDSDVKTLAILESIDDTLRKILFLLEGATT